MDILYKTAEYNCMLDILYCTATTIYILDILYCTAVFTCILDIRLDLLGPRQSSSPVPSSGDIRIPGW